MKRLICFTFVFFMFVAVDCRQGFSGVQADGGSIPSIPLSFQGNPFQPSPPPLALSCAKNEKLILVFNLSGAPVDKIQVELQEKDGIHLNARQIRPVPGNLPNGMTIDGLAPLGSQILFPAVSYALSITLKTPADHPSGVFKYHLVFSTLDKKIVQPIDLRVWRFSLPDDLPITIMASFRQDKDAFARYGVSSHEGLENVSDAYLLSMREYKINAISGYLAIPVDKIARGQHLTDFPQITRRLEFLSSKAGFRYFSLHERSMGSNRQPADIQSLRQNVQNVYPEVVRYLREKGWLGKATVKLWDEPKPDFFPRAVEAYLFFKKAVPEIRTICTGKPPDDQLSRVVDIWVTGAQSYDPVKIEAARRNGQEIWLYDNRLHGIDHPPAHQRLLAYFLYSHDFAGYYFWSVNFWPQDPWITVPGQGDKFRRGTFYYPDPKTGMPLPTLRLEALLRGFQDYQYLVLLKEAARQRKIADAEFNQIQREVSQVGRDINSIQPVADWEQMEAIRLKAGALLDRAS